MMTIKNTRVTHRFKQLAGALLLALTAAGAEAAGYAGTQFEIEMVVFAREDGMKLSRETWPSAPLLAYGSHWVDFDTPSSSDPMVPKLQPANNQLGNKVAALKRSAGYRVLFHKSWRQVLQQKRNAPAVLISGGLQTDNHHELEGSVTLSVSRYLHLSTDLWLSEWLAQPAGQPLTDGTGFDFQQVATAQPQGIAVPTRPRAVVTVNMPVIGEEPMDLAPSEADSRQDYHHNKANTAENGTDNVAESAVFRSGNHFSDTPVASGASITDREIEPREKLAARVAVLQEERRLRSGELHYIDHPTLGILVEVRTVAQREEPAASDALQDDEPLGLDQ